MVLLGIPTFIVGLPLIESKELKTMPDEVLLNP